jgi:hypothetical protein
VKPILILLVCSALFQAATFAQPLSVEAVLDKLVATSDASESLEWQKTFAFQRASKVDYMNPDGAVRNSVTRIYSVKPVNGAQVSTLITIDGRPATKKDDDSRSNARQTGEKGRTLQLTRDLISRYKFTLGPSERFNSRPVFVLYFSPKPDAPADGFFDKLINSMFGALYVDQEDFHLVKADAHLSQKVSFFGGIAGAIDRLDLTIVQRRIEPGIWLPELTIIDFDGRKLFSRIKFHCAERCSRFQKVAEGKAALIEAAKPVN